MELKIEGKILEFEPNLGSELYALVTKIMDDPNYNIDYTLSFSEFPACSDMKGFYPIEADLLLRKIERKSQREKQSTAEQCAKFLAVKKYSIKEFSLYPFVGVMVYYEQPINGL